MNKWDAALSRGYKLFGTSASDAFSKSVWQAQQTRLNKVRREFEESLKKLEGRTSGGAPISAKDHAQLYLDMFKIAEKIRSMPPGRGYIQIWHPAGAATTKSLMQQIKDGNFYAVAAHNPDVKVPPLLGLNTDDTSYSIILPRGDTGECDAITNHGRVVKLDKQETAKGIEWVATAAHVCGHDFDAHGSDPFYCGYIRIQCKWLNREEFRTEKTTSGCTSDNPEGKRVRYQFDYNYLFTQPHFLPGALEKLQAHFADKTVEHVQKKIRGDTVAMELIKKAALKDFAKEEPEEYKQFILAKKMACGIAKKFGNDQDKACETWEKNADKDLWLPALSDLTDGDLKILDCA